MADWRAFVVVVLLSLLKDVNGQLQRPQFHPLPPDMWINDPNGPIYVNGTHHLFFQYNPNAPVWGDIHWGHMTSTDLTYWTWEGIALSPNSDPLGADHSGCWTGSAVMDVTAEGGARPAILYTGVRTMELEHQRQLLAYGSEGLLQWERADDNPVLSAPPIDEVGMVNGFRDPSMWYDEENELWRMILGSGQDGKGGMILQYTSNDGLAGPWEFVSVILQGVVRNGSDSWECPDMFQLRYEDTSVWVLMFGDNGSMQRCYYMLGSMDEQFLHFTPLQGYEEGMILDAGDYYAAKTSVWEQERLLWGWVKEARDEAAYAEAGWAGVQALPRRLGLAGPTGPLTFDIAANLTKISTDSYSGHIRLGGVETFSISTTSQLLDMDILIINGTIGCVGANIRVGSLEGTTISYCLETQMLTVYRSRSSFAPWNDKSSQELAVPLIDNKLSLRILWDNSVLEVIAQRSFAITSRIYPDETSDGMDIFSSGAVPGQFLVSNITYATASIGSIY